LNRPCQRDVQQDQNNQRQDHARQQQPQQAQRAQQQQNQNSQRQEHARQRQPDTEWAAVSACPTAAAESEQRQPQRAQLQRTPQQQRAQQGEQRGGWQHRRAGNWASEHRTWQQRGGYNGYRIPDSYFRSYYGQDHVFLVFDLPFMEVGGYPRFQYGGYWFSLVDPYPEYWGASWYETDDVYVDYIDNGYYLYNRRYPGRPGVAISISL
jgi:hypothetical protein